MDQGSFDRLARLLGETSGRRAGLKAALAAVLGGPAAVAALEARTAAKRKDRAGGAGRADGSSPDAGTRKRRKTCKPACASGFDCVKVGKTRECVCTTGVTCGEACCALGQGCVDGACVAEPEQCIPAGEPCKGRGRRCCDGRVCASGQGGQDDVACYSPKTGACTTRTDCVYGMACVGGRCAPPAAAGLAEPCDTTGQQLCITPSAVCTPYTSPNAPAGTYCSLPVGKVCTGNPDCTCYTCFYPNGGVSGGGRAGRASANTRACCFPNGHSCQNDNQCCSGLSCVNGACGGTMCTPPGGDCTSTPCCSGACANGVCGGGTLTCTIKRSDFQTDAEAGAALKALVEAVDGPATITVGPGVYAPVPTDAAEIAALVVDRDLTIEACDPDDKPILDGGATVTPEATNVNAKDLTWVGGRRIMYVPAGRTVTVNGVHFRNGNGATAAEIVGDDYYMSGGGVLVKGDLTLKNLDITRCQGGGDDSAGYGGGVAAIEATGLVLNDVNITQCSGYTGGAIYARKTPLTYTGAAGAKAKLHYNYGHSYTGAIESYSEFGATRSGETTVTLQHLDARYNHCPDSGPGAIGIVDYLGYVSAEITDVEVIENSAYYAGGMWLEIGKADGDPATYPGKATLTNVSITGNACTESNSQAYGGGLLNLGRLHLGTGVVISGNMSNYGSGVLNLVATANVTCAAQAVSGNKSFTNVAAANGQTWADCYGGGNGSYSGQKMENRMPLACCATHYPCSVICGGVCCASGGSCNGTACP